MTLNVARGVAEWLATMLGAETAIDVDAVESHHDEPGDARLTGVVRGISAVSVPHRVRLVKRTPRPGMDESTGSGGMNGGSWIAYANRAKYTTISEPIPGSATITTTARVPRLSEPVPHEVSHPSPTDEPADDIVEDRLVGYLVDLEG